MSAELGSAVLSNRVDYARICDPVSARKAKDVKGMSTTNFYQSVIQGTWMNNKKKPLDDVRVRRAIHLSLDRPVLVDVVKDVAPMMMGGMIYPFSEWATPLDQLKKRLGYQEDVQETCGYLRRFHPERPAAHELGRVFGLDLRRRGARQHHHRNGREREHQHFVKLHLFFLFVSRPNPALA